jgi:Zn-dependent peptidase ImmA (M78 family)/transcriptional regulator with XRE-family HTH domain
MNTLYVRSQDGISQYREGATGLQLTYDQLECVLTETQLARLSEDGFAPVSNDYDICKLLHNRREALGLSIKEVAKLSHLREEVVKDIEDSGTRSPVRDTIRVAEVLSIPHALLVGVADNADSALALRLKKRTGFSNVDALSESSVAKISEAAWVIRAEYELKALLGEFDGKMESFSLKDGFYGDYNCPVWQHAMYLASRTRDILNLKQDEPIQSLRRLIEVELGLPLIETSIDSRIAGATIANGGYRGILLNSSGDNGKNNFIRRMTLAHELGHLLWDDEQNLDNYLIDNYVELEKFGSEYEPEYSRSYYIEARANAFAAEFLAPQSAVKKLYSKTRTVRSVMEHFGIGFTCAKYQIWNALDRNISIDRLTTEDVMSTDEWDIAENYSVAFMWDESIRDSRRGNFAKLVVDCEQKELITADSAACYLGCSIEIYNKQKSIIAQLVE